MATAERIRAAADERDYLLRKIAETQHAEPALAQLQPQVTDLTYKRFNASQLIATLAAAEKDKAEELDKLRNHSHVRRLLQREKHLAQMKKNEADYIEALSWTEKADVKRQLIDKELAVLKAQCDALRVATKEHRAAVNKLDDLYASVFDGPSPEVPEEDALEAAVKGAQDVYDEIQGRLSHAAAVFNHVVTAQMKAQNALEHVGKSLKLSSSDILATGLSTDAHMHNGSVGVSHRTRSSQLDSRERYELRTALHDLAAAEHSMALAQQMEPAVGGFVRASVPDGNHSTAGIMDQFVDNPLTDYWFHTEIESSVSGVVACEAVLREEVERADQRRAAIEAEKKPAEAALNEARKLLQDLRSDLFEKELRKRDGKKEEELPAYAG